MMLARVRYTHLSRLCYPFPNLFSLAIPGLCAMFHRGRYPEDQPMERRRAIHAVPRHEPFEADEFLSIGLVVRTI